MSGIKEINKVIAKIKILGIPWSKRVRHFTFQIDLKKEGLKFSFSGLTALVYNSTWNDGQIVFDSKNRDYFVERMLRNAFFNLFVQGKLRLTVYHDTIYSAFNLMKKNKDSYLFEIVDGSEIIDVVEMSIIHTIQFLEKKIGQMYDLEKFVYYFVKIYFQNDLIPKIQSLLEIEILKVYSNSLPWLQIRVAKRTFNHIMSILMNDVSYDLLCRESVSISNEIDKTIKQSPDFAFFDMLLKSTLEEQFVVFVEKLRP